MVVLFPRLGAPGPRVTGFAAFVAVIAVLSLALPLPAATPHADGSSSAPLRLAPEPARGGGLPESARSGTEPAPLGIADLGRSAAGPFPSQFNTTVFRGQATIGPIAADNSSISGDPTSVSLQLNAFYLFSYDGTTYAYWVQDVALIDTTTRSVEFEDNIWNASSVDLSGGALHGNGSVSGSGSESFYGDTAPCALPGACGALADPATVTLQVRAVLESGGVPAVRIAFGDGAGLVPFDVVEFKFAHSLDELTGFEVESGLGLPGSCPRCYGDVELVLGGPGYGYQTALVGLTRIDLSLEWWDGYDFVPVPDATDYGETTAEGLQTATIAENLSSGEVPTVTVTYGTPSELGALWSSADLSVVQITSVGTATGTVAVGTMSVPLVRGYAELLVLPGTYAISVTAGSDYSLGSPPLVNGESLTLEVGGDPVVFQPTGLPDGTLWSVVLGSRMLNGTGNITFGVAAGTYSYAIGTLSGYTANPTRGSVTVPAATDVVPIAWAHPRPTIWAQLLGVFGPWTPLLLFLLIVIGVAVAVSVHQSRRRPGAPPPDQEY